MSTRAPMGLERKVSMRAQLFIVVACLLPLWGCGEVIEKTVYRDHPVELDVTGDEQTVIGDPEVVLGLFEEQLFDELVDGQQVAIVYGLQGGTWVHLSLRVFGMRPDGEISATLGDLASIGYPLKLVRTAEGFLEVYDVPIPVNPPDGMPLSVLFGQTYTLTVTFASGEVSTAAEVRIVLVDG